MGLTCVHKTEPNKIKQIIKNTKNRSHVKWAMSNDVSLIKITMERNGYKSENKREVSSLVKSVSFNSHSI